jgi:DNA-binding CsgD family transcriptional regulator
LTVAQADAVALDASVQELVGAGAADAPLVLDVESVAVESALLEHLVDSASGATVVRAVGVESEMELPFAGLHQLCGPLLDRADSLPDPQREALGVVFGLRSGPRPDRFLVGLAVLSLFTQIAEERPLLCIVEDTQWLDRASALTLAFVARRLGPEPIGIVLAAREPGEDDVIARGEGWGVTFIEWMAAVLGNASGRYEEALAAALAADAREQELQPALRLAELVEAAGRSGHPEIAAEALQELAGLMRAAGTDRALGVEARSHALLSAGETAEALYREAIERLDRAEAPVELARAHLVYGEWLRREGRRRDSRAQLRMARGRFTAIGLERFAERARNELRATGEKARRRSAETRDDLTAQERMISELARDGLSNPEIGSRLFLSPRTVEWHLRKVYSKLGIRSRRELAEALAGPDRELVLA